MVWESIRETSSHATRQGTLSHSRLSSLSHCGLILAENRHWLARADLHFKHKKESQAGNDSSNFRTKSSYARKKPPPPPPPPPPQSVEMMMVVESERHHTSLCLEQDQLRELTVTVPWLVSRYRFSSLCVACPASSICVSSWWVTRDAELKVLFAENSEL